MYYGSHGPFKRAEGGQAITFENDKVPLTAISALAAEPAPPASAPS
jgi:hypothetical protein